MWWWLTGWKAKFSNSSWLLTCSNFHVIIMRNLNHQDWLKFEIILRHCVFLWGYFFKIMMKVYKAKIFYVILTGWKAKFSIHHCNRQKLRFSTSSRLAIRLYLGLRYLLWFTRFPMQRRNERQHKRNLPFTIHVIMICLIFQVIKTGCKFKLR